MQRILSKLPKWELDHREEDIRGWPLRDTSGRMIGTVSDLVADTETKCVTEVVLANGKRISAHDLWLGDHVVTLGDVAKEGAAEAKVREAQAKLAAVAAPATPPRATTPAAVTKTDDVVIPLVDEELQIGKREVEAGGVRVQTRTVKKPFHRDVHLNEEHVTVERRKVDEPLSLADADAQLHDRAVEVKATAERAVVSKSAHAVEEIVLKKERTARTEQVRDTVRHTDVEIMDLAAKDRSKI
jgi:uncharacterized protein (TIGR02271 family)